MNISQTIEDTYQIIALSGKLDSATTPQLSEFLNDQSTFGHKNLILNMVQLDYVSSAGLRLILNTSKQLKSNTKDFILCGMQDHIREIFEISGFDTFLDIHDSLEEAINSQD
jgi:anti-sigma B factor antagonist